MTLYVFIIIASILALGSVLALVRTLSVRVTNPGKLSSQLRPIDVNAFRNLMKESEKEYLRTHLSGREFRSVHRKRMLAVGEYVRSAARNAGILVRLGQASINDPDPAIATAAASMLENAMRLRLHAFQTLPKIYLSMLFPNFEGLPQGLPDGCDKLNRQAVILGCLQIPAQ